MSCCCARTGWKDGFFSLPAGSHDGSETLAAAAARELREETSLQADEQDMRFVHLLHCSSGDSDNEWLGAFFVAERWSGTPRLMEPDKHDDIGWYAMDRLPDNIIPYARQGLLLGMQQVAFSAHGWPSSVPPPP
jgi:8-oxo-dGTP diphosphatase